MDKVMEIMGKIGAQRHLVSIRDGFVAMIPVTMIGAFATLLNNLPFKPYQNFMKSIFGEGWTAFGGNIWWGSLATMALFLAISVAYNLAKSYDGNGMQAGLISLCSFLTLTPQIATVKNEAGKVLAEGWGFIPFGYVSNNALFTAIIVAIISTELYVRLSKVSWLTIKMPDGVPPAVSKSFAKLFPGMIAIAVVAMIGVLVSKLSDGKFVNDIISMCLSKPLTGVADSLGGVIAIILFIHVPWLFGLHGSNIALPITGPVLMDLGARNAELASSGATEGFHVMAGAFLDAFVYLGGSGVGLGLVLALVLAGRHRKEMISLGLAPACFNITEPLIFGLPIVLNPVFAIPFVLAPLLCGITSYLAIASGLVKPVILATMPWVTPPILGGLTATGHWTGGALAAFNLLLSIAVYIPFVMIDAKMAKKKMLANK